MRRSDQVRGHLALALIRDGGSRSDAAKVAGVTLQIVEDLLLRFNAEGQDGLAARKAPGRASFLREDQRARVAGIVEAGPVPAAHARRVDGLPTFPDRYGTSSGYWSHATLCAASFVQ